MGRTPAYLSVLVGLWIASPQATLGQAMQEGLLSGMLVPGSNNFRLSQPTSGPAPSLSFGIGFADLPDVSFAAATPGANPAISGGRTAGPSVSWEYTHRIRPTYARGPLYLQYSGAYSHAGDRASTTEKMSGSGFFALTAGSAPAGSIDLATSADAIGAASSGTVISTGPTGGTITGSGYSPAGSGAAISLFAVSGTGSNRAFLALTTDGDAPSAAAYAAIVDATGYTFLATGDTSGTLVTDHLDDNFRSFSHDLRLATTLDAGGGWTISPGLGPMYRSTRRSVSRTTTINIDEGPASATSIPLLNFGQRGEVNTRYVGLTAGVGLARRVPGGWLLSIDAELGVAQFRGRLDALSWAAVADTGSTYLADQRAAVSGVTRLGTLSLGVSRPLGGGVMRLGVYANYISDVPTFAYQTGGALLVTNPGGAGSASFAGAGQSQTVPSLRTDGMSSYGINLSFNQSF